MSFWRKRHFEVNQLVKTSIIFVRIKNLAKVYVSYKCLHVIVYPVFEALTRATCTIACAYNLPLSLLAIIYLSDWQEQLVQIYLPSLHFTSLPL